MNYETGLPAKAVSADEQNGFAEGFERSFGSRRRIAIIAACVIGALILFGLLLHGGDDQAALDAANEQLPVVTVVAPGTTNIAGTIDATGTLAARREMPVGSVGEGGRVMSVPVEPGDWVRKGQVLAVIDRSVQTQQIASAAAQIDVARADAQLAQANLDRGLKLVDKGFISKADIDRLTATRDSAVARVRVAQAQTGELRASASRLNIVAPEAGLVLTRDVEPGQVVSGGSGVLFSIARDGQLELLARLSEEDLANVSVGIEAQVRPVGSEKSFTGHVWQVSPTIDEQTRQGIARVALAYAPELRPGGFASATIRSGAVTAPLLPESAIQSDEKGSFVLVVGKDGKVARRIVKTGTVTANGIAVIQGLTGRERVVLRAGGFLSPGDKVKPRLLKAGGEKAGIAKSGGG